MQRNAALTPTVPKTRSPRTWRDNVAEKMHTLRMETPSSRESDRANVSPIFEITSRLIVLKKGLSILLFLYLKYFCFKRIEAFSALLHKTNNVNRFSMIYFYLILTFYLFVFWIGQGQLSFQVARCLYNIWFKMSKRFRAKLKKKFRGLKKI